jgi:DHA1 family tetracycline resistance protein-like MFS transporter
VLYLVARSEAVVYLAIAVGALQGFIQPSIQALNSRAVDAKSQGELQGANASGGQHRAIVGPPHLRRGLCQVQRAAGVAQIPSMPLLLAAGFALVAALLFLAGRSGFPRTPGNAPAPAE